MLVKGMSYTENAHGTRVWGTGVGQNPFKSLSPLATDGPGDEGWGNVPPTPNEALTETEGAA
jgi:hypothetical protein